MAYIALPGRAKASHVASLVGGSPSSSHFFSLVLSGNVSTDQAQSSSRPPIACGGDNGSFRVGSYSTNSPDLNDSPFSCHLDSQATPKELVGVIEIWRVVARF